MIFTNLTRKALEIATKAHEGQVDKAGVTYILHPVHLAEQMDTPIETAVALLHDVVEDSDYTLKDLIDADFPYQVIEAVDDFIILEQLCPKLCAVFLHIIICCCLCLYCGRMSAQSFHGVNFRVIRHNQHSVV